MNKNSFACSGATALLFVLGLACSAGVKPTPTTGTAGTGSGTAGTSGAAGTSGGGTSGVGTAGSTGFDASIDIATADSKSDGVCAATMTAAEPLPLDLYVTVDTSRSLGLTLTTGGTVTKWDAVKSALNSFFSDPQSAGIGAGLGFFPLVQSTAAVNCTADGPCGSYGPCDRRKTCVTTNSMTPVVVPLCVDTTTCMTGQNCDLIKDCGIVNGSQAYCAADGTATCSATCMDYAGYCHARDVCDVTAYATPVVPIAALSGSATGQAAALATSLSGHSPDGYTPTGPALKGAIQYAQQYANSHAGHKLAVVLVTDGLPLAFTDYFDTQTGIIHPGFPRAECNPSDIPGIAGVAAAGATPAAGTPAVPTFVIGVASQQELSSIGTMLNQIATGGGTAPAIQIATSQDVSAVLRTKLAEIRTKAIACDYKLPATGVDFKKVNVSFTSGAGADTAVGHAPIDGTDGSGCDARGGWYYDKDPASGTPTKITACPTTCSMFQTDLNGHVNVVLGCPTIDVE
jgi:hypothetical protein